MACNWQTRGQRGHRFGSPPIYAGAMSLKQRMPFLRSSFVATGDSACPQLHQDRPDRRRPRGRPARTTSRPTPAAATSTTCWPPSTSSPTEKSMLINVGDEKGELLDAAVRRADPTAGAGARHLLRLRRTAHRPRGTRRAGCSRSNSPRPTPKWPDGSGRTPASTTGSPVWSAPSATAARRSTRWPAEHGFGAGDARLLFIDHDKNAYLTDLQSILDRGWLHRGSIVVADNVRIPGAPKYRAYMREQQGKLWNTVEHKTHVRVPDAAPRPGAGVGVPGRLTRR